MKSMNKLDNLISDMLQDRHIMKSIREIEELIAQGRPLSEEDWGTEREITLENQVYAYLKEVLSAEQMEAFENYANRAVVRERMDAALRVIKGDTDWLSQWGNK